MSQYASLAAHSSMVFDNVRNQVYAEAIRSAVRPDSVVLDLGAGLGLLGLLAAKAGAAHVYLVDPSPAISLAEKVAADNGLSDKVTCIQSTIEQADLPDKVDLIISVFTGNFLLEENLLPSLFYARDRYLKPTGRLIPDKGDMRVVPVCAPGLHVRLVANWSEPAQGIHYRDIRSRAANTVHFGRYKPADFEMLAKPVTLASLDFATATEAKCVANFDIPIETSGECHGFLGWFRTQLGDNWLSTSPLQPATHWSQVFLPLDPSIQVEAGKELRLRLNRPEEGDWTWISDYEEARQQHSTFFSRLLNPAELRCNDNKYSAQLNDRGALFEFVLARLNGRTTTAEIMEEAAQRFGDHYASRSKLDKAIQRIVTEFGR